MSQANSPAITPTEGNNKFTHLHCHSSHSWDGIQPAEEIPKTVKERGMNAVALTDHGYMGGVHKFVKACRDEEVKPLIGLEAYYVEDALEQVADPHLKGGSHLVLIAQNATGYQNLNRLTQYSFDTGWYRGRGMPMNRIDHKTLLENNEGLILTTACMASPLGKYYAAGEEDKGLAWFEEIREAFKDHIFLEVGPTNIPDQVQYNDQVILPLAKRTGVPIVLGADAHMKDASDLHYRIMAMCVDMGSRKNKIVTLEEFPFDQNDYQDQWMFGPDHALALTQAINLPKEAITNTQYVADLVDGGYYESIATATEQGWEDLTEGQARKLLREKAKAGLTSLFKVSKYEDCPPEYKEELERNLEITTKFKYTSYFLRQEHIIQLARDMDIPVGPARGSGGGFLLCWALGITSPRLDPLKYGLFSERFLNPGRVTLELDFSADGI